MGIQNKPVLVGDIRILYVVCLSFFFWTEAHFMCVKSFYSYVKSFHVLH